MPRELKELRQKIGVLKKQAEELLEKRDFDGAKAIVAKVEELRTELELKTDLSELDKKMEGGPNPTVRSATSPAEKACATDAFLKLVRRKETTAEERALVKGIDLRSGMSGRTDPDGGYLIPEDISTQINLLARAEDALETFVNVQTTPTREGSRVLEKLSDITPFAQIGEGDLIGETDNPKFTQVSYNIKDFAGILPLSRTMLADSDQNILEYVVRWLGAKARITRNKSILEQMKKLPTATISDITGLKEVLNVKLDPAITATASVVLNQSGFHFLDQLKDEKGNYILQPDPTQATRRLLFGAHPVQVVADRFLPSTGNVAPIFIGDLSQAIVLFNRERFEFSTTSEGGDAFKRNTLDLRVIMRHDAVLWDTEAALFGKITLASGASK